MARILEGRPVARAIIDRARDDYIELSTRTGWTPELAVLLAGDDGGARAYFRAIRRTFLKAELPVRLIELPATISEQELGDAIDDLNRDPSIAGILVLQPLPPHLPRQLVSTLIDPSKDVDGGTIESVGRLALGLDTLLPSTPAGGMEILRHYEIPFEGRRAVVLGRSTVVGRPMALLLLAEHATVTICHSRTRDLGTITREADILASATGHPGLVTPDMVKPGATVIDFGVNVLDGTIVGDVDPTVEQVAGAITPVPGGTGVVTNAVLVRNTLMAAQRQAAVMFEAETAAKR